MTYQTWNNLQPHEVADKVKKGSAVNIIDVREYEEWISGHIPGARHISLSLLPIKMEELDRNTEFVMVCQSGGRSARACEYLANKGYHVINMIGGMSEWTGDLVYGG